MREYQRAASVLLSRTRNRLTAPDLARARTTYIIHMRTIYGTNIHVFQCVLYIIYVFKLNAAHECLAFSSG